MSVPLKNKFELNKDRSHSKQKVWRNEGAWPAREELLKLVYSPSIRYGQSKTLAYNEKGIRSDSEIDSWLLPIGDLDKAIKCCMGHGTFSLTIQRITGWLLCLAPAQ